MPLLTDPSIKTVTTLNSGDLLYLVDVLDPSENPAGTSAKITKNDLAVTLGIPSNIKIVNSISDLPTPTGGIIQLEPVQYLFNEFIDIGANSLRLPDIDPGFDSVYLTFSTLNCGIQNSGVPLFVGTDFGSLVIDKGVFLSPTSIYFNLDNAGQVFIFNSIFLSSAGLGTIKCDSFSTIFTSFYDYGTGFNASNRTDLVRRTQFALIQTGLSASKNNATTLVNASGNLASIFIESSNAEIQSNETLFNFDETLKANNCQITVRGFTIPVKNGLVFAATSLMQDYIKSVYSGNIGIEDSTVSALIRYGGTTLNTSTTTISASNTNTPINTNQTYEIVDLQRFLVQDTCTFNNTTNVVTTTFNHGLVLNNRVFLNAYTGSTLPPELNATTEYYVVNPAATTFQLALTAGGAAIDFSTNGTGTLQYRHKDGVSSLGHLIYVGLEDTEVRVGGWVELINATANSDKSRCATMKISLTGTFSLGQVGSSVTVNNTVSISSQIGGRIKVKTGEGIVMNIANQAASRNLIAQSILTDILI